MANKLKKANKTEFVNLNYKFSKPLIESMFKFAEYTFCIYLYKKLKNEKSFFKNG